MSSIKASIRPMINDNLEARRIFRFAFGTFLGAPDFRNPCGCSREYVFEAGLHR